jgi:hypothetical protein
MKLLTSNFIPLDLKNRTFTSRWEELFQDALSIKIGIGYASNDSLLYLRKLIELNQPKKLDLCLGMAYFEGLSTSQLDASEELNRFLKEKDIGSVRISRTFPFHGKVQSFNGRSNSKTYLVGSSNLSNIVPVKGIERRNYEVDLEISGESNTIDLDILLDKLFTDSSQPFEEISPQIKIKDSSNTLLSSRSDVAEISESGLENILAHLTKNSFEIPLKDAPKSNLNAYFGEGRINQQGFVKPRHWYEVEIIVDLSVQRSSKNYPANTDFIAYTDDGYKFTMRTSGDYGKNLRSKDDLTILGRWLKGRMENSSSLRSGELITMESFKKYGRDSITFTQTNLTESMDGSKTKLDVWYLDFSQQKTRK